MPSIQPSADYAVGPIVQATDINGVSRPIIAPGFVILAADGSPATTSAAIGNTDDAAWNGTDPDATVISLLKAIAVNTAP